MTTDLAILRMAGGLAAHAAARQSVIADNVANADTPGYKARDIKPFADAYSELSRPAGRGFQPAATRPGHLLFDDAQPPPSFEPIFATRLGTSSPNGNTVGLEDQMIRSAEVKLNHDLALGVYAKSLEILRASMGRPR